MLSPQFLLDINRELGRFMPGERASKATEFQPGVRSNPDTEIKPGQHLSVSTEFKPGQPAHNRLPVGSVTIRTLDGVQRAFVKIAEPSRWRERAKVVWEREHGCEVPRGLVIHHKDHNALNDHPDNLVALTRKQHALVHLPDRQAAGFGSDEARAKAHAALRASREDAA